MAKYREAPCIHYVCHGKCSKGFEADQAGKCQKCKKYMARKGYKSVGNQKRRKEKERYID